MRKPCTWLVVALLGSVPLAGCGGGGSSSTSSATSTTTSQSGEAAGGTSSSATKTPGGTSAETGAAHPLTPKEQVDACKRAIQAPSQLSASTKAKLQKSCEQAGGGASAQRKIVHEVCEALAARQPAAATRERALAICRTLR
jgi:hypothetical protein